MALTSVFSNMDNDPWKISVVFSALMELVLAFLFLLSVCISIISSTIIRFFHLRPPCFCSEPYGGASWNGRPKQNPKRLFCDYHANKLSLLQNLLLNGGFPPVHSLCEDCMLLNCTSAPTNSSFVNSNPDHGHTHERFSSAYALIHVNNCYICSLKKQSSVLLPSASRPRSHGHPRCCSCKDPIEEMDAQDDEFLKEKFAKVYADDSIPSCETEEHAVFEEIPFKDQGTDILGDAPALEHGASLSDYEKYYGRNYDGELQPQTDHVHGQFSSDMLAEEEQDGEVLLQNDSPDCKVLSDEEQQDDQSDHLDSKLSSEALMEDRATLKSELPLTISESYQESVTNPLEDRAVAVMLLSADLQPQIDPEKSEADVIKELKDALEAEKEAYSAIYMELEEDRNSSAIAANETMAMISRLQEEKAAVQMESRQFKRMVEEKAAFDQEAIALLKDILCKREAERFELEREVEIYRSRLFDRKIRKWRQQRSNGEDFEKHNGKKKLQLPDWNERSLLLLEGRKDEEIIKERFQGPLEDSRCSTSWDYDHAGPSRLIRRGSKMKLLKDPTTLGESQIGSEFTIRNNELLLSSNGKNLPDHSMAAETKSRQDDSWLTRGSHESEVEKVYFQVNLQEASLAPDDSGCEQKLAVSPGLLENVYSTIRQSFAPEEKGRFIEEADKVDDTYYQLMPAHSMETQRLARTAAEIVTSSSVDRLETLSSSFSNVNKDESARMDTCVENYVTKVGAYSQREDEVRSCNGRSSLENEDESNLESCKYINELIDDCITIEVEPTPIHNTEHLSSQQGLDAKAIPLLSDKYEIDNELYEVPTDITASKESHKAYPEELQTFERHSTNLAQNTMTSFSEISSVDRQARERDSYDMKFSGNFESFPGNGCQYGMLKDSGQRNLFFDKNERPAGSNEQTSDDDLDQDSLSSANEFIPGCFGYDPRTASMIKRDHQRMAVEEDVKELTLRLQVLEDDSHLMKSLMETFRSENREMRFPDDIERQLQQLNGFEEKLENLKRLMEPVEPTSLPENVGKKRRR